MMLRCSMDQGAGSITHFMKLITNGTEHICATFTSQQTSCRSSSPTWKNTHTPASVFDKHCYWA